jgi:hypothetical protein
MRLPFRPPFVIALAAAVLAAAVLAAASLAAPAGAQQAVPALGEYRWKQRVLAVFAPAPGAAAESTYRAQRRELARAGALLAERDVVVLDLADDAARARTLRRQLGVPDGAFAAVLVGKDGGVKLRRRTLLPADVVLSTVDAMPMGAAEARRRRSGRGAR